MGLSASIVLNDLSVTFDIHNASSRSIRNVILNKPLGGLIKNNTSTLKVKALSNLSLSINSGDRVGLVGHNGSGKSTFLRVLSGIHSPTSGTIKIKGRVSPLIDLNLGIDPECTGLENIRIRSAILGIKKNQVESYCADVINFSGLDDFINLPVRTYSAGMRLRLAFATSAMFNPEILIMDEWISVGDDQFRKKITAHLNSLIGKSEIFIIASHSIKILEDSCNRIMWFKKGEIYRDGQTQNVLREFIDETKKNS